MEPTTSFPKKGPKDLIKASVHEQVHSKELEVTCHPSVRHTLGVTLSKHNVTTIERLKGFGSSLLLETISFCSRIYQRKTLNSGVPEMKKKMPASNPSHSKEGYFSSVLFFQSLTEKSTLQRV